MAFIQLIMTLTNIPHVELSNAIASPAFFLSLWIVLFSENSTHRNHLLLKALFTLRTEKLLYNRELNRVLLYDNLEGWERRFKQKGTYV